MNIAPGTFSFLPGIRLQNGSTSAQYQATIGAAIAVQ
jgi:hypothetical protein